VIAITLELLLGAPPFGDIPDRHDLGEPAVIGERPREDLDRDRPA
jgi:hypothetical protein